MNNNTEEHKFIGTHYLGELYGVSYEKLNDIRMFEDLLSEAIIDAGVNSEGILKKKFLPQGITILILLSESHISVHTYPEYNSLFFDVFTCGEECKSDVIVRHLIQKLIPITYNIQKITRGSK